MTGLLSGVKILDVGKRISGPYCARTLANMGADVIKVEPPEGDESRRMGPFPPDGPHPEKSGLFLALNANKQGVTLDLTAEDGVIAFLELARAADIVIDNQPLGHLDSLGIGYDVLSETNPGIIVTSITPFGNRGLNMNWKATDLTIFHMSGNATGLLGPVEDPDTEPPIRAGGHQSEFVAGMAATTATLMALFQKRMTGKGSHVDVSEYEAMVTQTIAGLASSAYGRPNPSRSLKEAREASAIGGVLPTTDGYVAISPREDAQWARWLEVMENPDWAEDERFATRQARQSNNTELWELLSQWSRQYSKHDIARWGQDKRIPCFAVNTIADLLENEHLAVREFFLEIDHPVAGTLKYPGAPYRFSNTPLPLDARPAPLLGEHNQEILEGLES
ncbi:MAG: CoA transferase [SAR202 cluster bacterium]|nr:CoA transferase [SAR202 cluster bacterium]MDP6514935.1 CoA transferase [SAR202 cluster bacterium]MDP6714801.1 CoA transferase [SAR202 cluster bacterium]